MTTFVRVEDKTTGHQYDLPKTAVDPEAHELLNSPEFPDLTGPQARPRPPVHNEKKKTPAKAAATTSKES